MKVTNITSMLMYFNMVAPSGYNFFKDNNDQCTKHTVAKLYALANFEPLNPKFI